MNMMMMRIMSTMEQEEDYDKMMRIALMISM